ncbi:MAG: peptidoglycan editing factor PgeF [Alphaproteobacteria bacterium]|nr:peptidoglycan editing factor PgeF [Alphaproteobacteria bacterium]
MTAPPLASPPSATSPGLAALPNIRHGFFSRVGGVSDGIYASLNCGFGSDDARDAVAENRARVARALGCASLVTVHQVHGTAVAHLQAPWTPDAAPKADAVITTRRGIALGILAADCAPVLLADDAAGVIGAAHAGWKGALSGVVEATIDAMEQAGAQRRRIVAAIGPCIGPASYEVGLEFEARFVAADDANARFFGAGCSVDKRQFDLPGYLAARLGGLGLARLDVLGLDTLPDPTRWFSYRRTCLRGEPDYGRQISAIALPPD